MTEAHSQPLCCSNRGEGSKSWFPIYSRQWVLKN